MAQRQIGEVRGIWQSGLEVEAGEGRRRLSGVAVPWDSVGYTSVGPVRYLPGSLDVAARPPVDRDHDRTRLVGKVIDAADDGQALRVVASISPTALGDETLALAADGVTTGFSATVRPTEYRFEDDDDHGTVLVVARGEWVGLAVTPDPAYSDARIATVAAAATPVAAGSPKDGVMNLDLLTRVCVAADEDRRKELVAAHRSTIEDAGLEVADVERLIEADVLAAQPPPTPVTITGGNGDRHPVLPMSLGRLAQQMILAQRGDSQAAARVDAIRRQFVIQADLDETTNTLGIGVVPPQYTSEVLRGLPVHAPLTNGAVRRAALPAAGMQIVKPAWTVLPEGDWITTENTEPASDPVAIGTRDVPVLTWGHAVRASINLVERSTFGGFAQNYYEQTVISYQSDKEARIAQEMVDAILLHNGFTATTGTTVKANIAELVSAVIDQQTDSNGNFRGLVPDFAAVAANVWETLSSTDTDAGTAFGSAVIQIGSLAGTLGSLRVLLVPALDDGGIIVGSSMATELRDGNELQLRAVMPSTMSYELGVHANCSIDVEYPAALAASGEVFS